MPNDDPCDDGDACSLEDQCRSGACGSGAAMNCDDGNDHTTDTCSSGSCVNTCTTCMSDDVCVAGTTAAACDTGDAVCASCDDGNAFSTDTCSSSGSCIHSCVGHCRVASGCVAGDSDPAACGTVGGLCTDCDDDNDCTTELCNSGSCASTNKADGAACSSGVCLSGRCVECRASADCPLTTAAACIGNVCSPCTVGSSHCAHLAGTTTCDRSTGPGVCVPDGSCTSGCLVTVNNTCVPGTWVGACGVDGDDCVDCSATRCLTSGPMAGRCGL